MVVALVTALALALRTWQIGQVPPSPDVNEVSIGYNAHSLLRTGRDEYGTPYPLIFRAFGEFKRPAYINAVVPSVAVLGLRTAAVRLPAALIGAATVPLLYLLASQLWPGSARARWAAGLLAISPWHIQLTRPGREVAILVFGTVLLVLSLIKVTAAPHRGPWALAASLGFLLCTYSYPGAVITTPALTALTLFALRSKLVPTWRRTRRWVAGTVLTTVVLALPYAQQVADGRALMRQEQVSLLSDPDVTVLGAAREARAGDSVTLRLLNVPGLVAARSAVGGYLSHFDPSYLFARGDQEWRHHAPDHGQLYLWELPAVLIGLIGLVTGGQTPTAQVVLGWLLIAPLPAAFTQLTPHAVRSVLMVPPLHMISATGAAALWNALRWRAARAGWLALLVGSIGYYLIAYFRYYPVEHAFAWSDGTLDTYRAAQSLVERGLYRTVVIPHELRGGQYAFALFATRYDPANYLAQGGTREDPTWPGYPERGPMTFQPFQVRVVDWTREPEGTGALYVWHGGLAPPEGFLPVQVILNTSGSPALQLIARS